MASKKFGLSGQCDIVEFHSDGRVVPIEYKRGKPKSHHADEVQLCAQTLCLEEMLNTSIDIGYLFYGKRKRRTKVVMDSDLRDLTEKTTRDLHALIDARQTPPAFYEPRKCDACSLIDYCQPWAFRLKRGAESWFNQALAANCHTAHTGETAQ